MDTVLMPLWHILPSREMDHRVLDIAGRYQYALYDAMILAAALEGGGTRFYSGDLQDGQKIGQLVIENPIKDCGRDRQVEIAYRGRDPPPQGGQLQAHIAPTSGGASSTPGEPTMTSERICAWTRADIQLS